MENIKYNNYNKLFLIILGIWILCQTESYATHIVGGTLTYKHVTGDTYQVKVVLRRDCFLGDPEASFDDPASIGIFTSSGALAVWLGNNGQIRIPFMSSDTLNEFIQSDCGFEGTQVCVHETTYIGNVILPFRPGGYTLAYQRCCRNATLSNIKDPLETGGTWWVNINEEALLQKNSTPEFIKWPAVYICANTPFEHDHSAIDKDGDSLVYKLCAPSTGATKINPKPQPPGFPPYDNVIWQSPYGLADMIGGVPLKIDSKTGKLTANPNLVGQFLAGVCVEEYRNGILIGIVRRDFQFNVRVCTQPPLAQFTTTETNCDGLKIDFFNNSLSASTFEWDFNYPSLDPAFKSTEKNPSFIFPSIGTYNVRLRVTRGSDGCFDTLIQKVSIFNNKITPDFDFTLSSCDQSSERVTLSLRDKSLFNEPGYQIDNWQWTVVQNGDSLLYSGKNPEINLSYTGDIKVTLLVSANNGCVSTLVKTIKVVDITPTLDFSLDYIGCPVDNQVKIRLINLSAAQNPFATIQSTKWTVGNQTFTGDTIITTVTYSTQPLSVKLETGFVGLCNVDLTRLITLTPPPSAGFTVVTEECGGFTLDFENTSTETNSFFWTFNSGNSGPLFTSTDQNPTFTFPTAGKYMVQLIATRLSDGCQDSITKEIGVFENKIVPDFTYTLSDCNTSKDSLKLGLSDISTTNEAGFDITTRTWTITQNGQSTQYTGANPTINLSFTGEITAKLVVVASNGCTSEITKQISPVDVVPTLDFELQYTDCPVDNVLSIRLVNLSAAKNPFATIQSTKWKVGNQNYTGDSLTIQIPYSTTPLSVQLETGFVGLCTVELTKQITLLPPPDASYDVITEVCNGLTVAFGNTSKNTDSYFWRFNMPSTDPAFTSTSSNPTFTFPASANYMVQLIATRSSDGCQDSITKEIGVFENKIVPDFTYTLSDCNTSKDSLKLGLSDISTTNEAGFDITTRTWTITQNGQSTQYTGANPTINLSFTGEITAKLEVVASNGCTSEITKQISPVDVVPTLDFELQYTDCPVDNVLSIRLVNLSAAKNPFATIQSTKWKVGNQNYTGDSLTIQIPYSTTPLSVQLETGFVGLCTVELTKQITLLPPPDASYDVVTEVCNGLTVAFGNKSKNTDSFLWQFNTPSTDPAFSSTSNNPTFTFLSSAKYMVQLIATRSSDGCQDSITKEIGVFENKIVSDFTYTLSDCNTSKDSLKLGLSDISATNEAGFDIITRTWTITQNGQSTQYTGANPTINLSFTGEITAKLEVVASNGCTSEITKQISPVDVVPTLDFELQYTDCPVDNVLSIRLVNLSAAKNPFATIHSTKWKVGNQNYTGDSLTIQIPYSTTPLSVQLETGFVGLCTVELTKQITLLPPPDASYDVITEVCNGLTLAFGNTSKNTDSFLWQFNTPSTDPAFTSTSNNPTFTYKSSGNYVVLLVSTRTSDGCKDSIAREIGVFENKIVPDFTFLLSDCEESTDSIKLDLNDISETNEVNFDINDRKWIITQNGITKNFEGKTPNISVAPSGDIVIKLDVTATNGCTSTISKTVKTSDIVPELDFKFDYVGCPRKDSIDIQLVNLSGPKNPFAEIIKTSWFINNTLINGDSAFVSVPYNLNGVDIRLETSFKGNCKINLSQKLPLLAPPLAGFNVKDAECSGLTVRFENTSSNAQKFDWDLDFPNTTNNSISTDIEPMYTYSSGGIYQVILKATRLSDGCFDTIARMVPVFENSIMPDFTIKVDGCDPTTDKLKLKLEDISTFDQPGYAINKWNWTVDQNTDTIKYVGKTTDILLSYTGTVNITLDIASSNGCIAKISKPFKISDIVPKSDFNFELIGCPSEENAEIRVNNLSGPLNPFAIIDSSTWIVNGQNVIGNNATVVLPKNTGAFDVTLSTFFGKECKVTTNKSFNLTNVLPKVDYQLKTDNCPTNDLVSITINYKDSLNQNIDIDSLNWQLGIAGELNNYMGPTVAVTIPKDSILALQLVGNFANGCSDTLQRTFLPGPYASIKFAATPLILCPGETKNLLTNSNPNWTYTWSPTAGLDLTNPNNPTVKLDKNTTYKVTVSDGVCSVIDSIPVVALATGVILDINASNFTCDGNVNLTVTGGVGPGTYKWGLDPNISQVLATGPIFNTSFVGREKEYFVRFDGNACATIPAKIKVTNQKPQILVASPFTICKNDTVQVFTVNDISEHIVQFQWKNDKHILSGANTSRPTITVGANDLDSFYLYFTATNQFNCVTSDSVLVRIAQNPAMDFNVNLKECGKYEVCFNISNTNYKGFIAWDFGDPTTINDRSLDNNPCYTYKEGGEFMVTLTNLIQICPFKPISKMVTVNPQVILQKLKDTIICVGTTATFKAAANIKGVTYEWFNDTGTKLFTGETYTSTYTTDTKLVLKGKDIYGCIDSVSVNVNVFKFQYDITAKDSLCFNESTPISINITTPSNYTFLWFPANLIASGGNTNSPVIKPEEGKTIFVALEHKPTGCKDTTSYTPKVTKPFFFTPKVPSLLCKDVATEVAITIDNPNNYNYEWSPKDCIVSGGSTLNPMVKINKDKTLTVKVTNRLSGCSQSMDIDVKSGADVVVNIDANPDFTIFEGESVELFIDNPILNAKYKWSTGDSTLRVNVAPKETTDYQVTVTDGNGCTASDNVTVTVRTAKCDDTDVFIPNAFSPNNDGNNDVFRVRSNFIDAIELIIYNRWGQELFRITDKNGSWDGTYKGEELPPDSYAYFLRVICVNQEVYSKRGNVNLMR